MKTFSERIINAALSIPSGKITTYGKIARACGGGAQASRSITGILAKANKEKSLNIPFHRIVYANGTIWVGELPNSRSGRSSITKKRMALYQ